MKASSVVAQDAGLPGPGLSVGAACRGLVGKQLPQLPLSRVTSALALARVLLCVFPHREGQSTKKEGESTRETISVFWGK